VLRLLRVVWAGPNTLLGLFAGCLALATGGRARIERGVIEFYGGWLTNLFNWLLGGTSIALTLGHTVLATSRVALDIARDHEHVHVCQYERWGPLFLPAYCCGSLWAWYRGGRFYRDNPFEREAYGDERHGH
jgi:hypothetical protein